MKSILKYVYLIFVSLLSGNSFSQNNNDTTTSLYGFKKSDIIDSTIFEMGYGGETQFIWHWYGSGDTTSGSFNYYFPSINTIVSGNKTKGRMNGAWIVIEPSKKYLNDKEIAQSGNAWASNANHHKIVKYYYFNNDTLLFKLENADFQGEKDIVQNSFAPDRLNQKIEVTSTRIHSKKGKIDFVSYLFVYGKQQFLMEVFFKKGELYMIQCSVV